MNKVLLFLLSCTVLACADRKVVSDTVYFTGEIVNPSTDFVVLYKNDIVLDSAKIDENNRFLFTLEEVEEGLHHFDHAPELQYVYLEKGDSVVVRLNTVAFDESLVFSGSNEEVNNFMIEMFLNYEDEERLVYSFYSLSPADFGNKIDSLREQKINELESLTIGEELSEKAFSMAKASIDYNSYLYKEKYPFYHKKKTSEDAFHKLGADFYAYRKNLNFSNKDLAYFRPYYDFMIHHFGNLSYMTCAQNCGTDTHLAKKNYLHLNRHKMILIDSLVKDTGLRDNLFRNVAMDYLLEVHEVSSDCDTFIKEFEDLSNNSVHEKEIVSLYDGIKRLQENQEVPELLVEDFEGKSVSLKDISKNNTTVFYFWTTSQRRHFKNVMAHIKELEQKHPDYNFVGINLKTNKSQWLSFMEDHNLDMKNQYFGNDFNTIQNTLIIDNLNKCVITKDTTIIDAFAEIFTSSIKTNKKALVSK